MPEASKSAETGNATHRRLAGRPFQPVETSEEEHANRTFLLFNAIPSWLASFLVNLSLILMLALVAISTERNRTLVLEAAETEVVGIDESALSLEELDIGAADPLESQLSEPPPQSFTTESEPMAIETDVFSESATLQAADATSFEGQQFNELTQSDLANEFGGRGDRSRNQLLRKYGGNAASEAAVTRALEWIADHQLPDGGWNLDHTIGPEVNGRPRTSPNPGEKTDARMGATALALLPFLGNGQTHRNGKHRKVVFDGLKFLMESAVRRGKGLTYWDRDGEMYSHGLVAIVFNEAYAMTRDEKLRDFAQGTLYFIEDCQDPAGGGWRYAFQEPGDTSVVGWQIMALKSGKATGLKINSRTLKRASKFLDSVSTDYGAYYGYRLPPVKTASGKFDRQYRARTAVGLLCRMYLGWDREREGLVKGINWLSSEGPDNDPDGVVNMYYNYYATQLMKHYGGEVWRQWNLEMRDFLIETQASDGPARGSWLFNPDGQYQAPGGRLYCTSLCTLTLEVYYRFLPLYTEEVMNQEFPLD